mgnify:CR=1 FL=1
MAQRLTKKQRIMLDFIEQFLLENGYSPTFREIASGLGYGSLATVAAHINNLVLAGHLIKTENSARSLELVRGPEENIASLSDLKIYLAKHWAELDDGKKQQVRQAFKVLRLERLLPEDNFVSKV